MRAAAIDVGTNSIKMCVGEKGVEDDVRLLAETSVNARLGEGFVATRELQPDAMKRALEAIRDQVNAAREWKPDAIRVVGTSAIRDARNREDFIERARNELGVEIEPLSEHDEARLSYSAVARDPALGKYDGMQLVADIGGGSTEFIYGERDQMDFTVSVRAGAIRLTEKCLRGDKQTVCQLVDAGTLAEKLLSGIARRVDVGRFVGIGGSVVNLARIWAEVPAERTSEVHGIRLNYRQIREVLRILVSLTVEERKELVGLEPERADVILAGAVILERSLALFGIEDMVVCTRGLRHGLLYEMLL